MVDRLIWLAAALAAIASLTFALAAPEHLEDAWLARGFFVAVATAEMGLAAVLASLAGSSERDPDRVRSIVMVGTAVAGAGVLAFMATLAGGWQHGADMGTHGGGPTLLDVAARLAEVALIVVLVAVGFVSARDPRPSSAH
jgi:hypothetical protein